MNFPHFLCDNGPRIFRSMSFSGASPEEYKEWISETVSLFSPFAWYDSGLRPCVSLRMLGFSHVLYVTKLTSDLEVDGHSSCAMPGSTVKVAALVD